MFIGALHLDLLCSGFHVHCLVSMVHSLLLVGVAPQYEADIGVWEWPVSYVVMQGSHEMSDTSTSPPPSPNLQFSVLWQ